MASDNSVMGLKDAREYAENIRKFAKSQMIHARTSNNMGNYQYYLGRMNSAKQIRDAIIRMQKRKQVTEREKHMK